VAGVCFSYTTTVSFFVSVNVKLPLTSLISGGRSVGIVCLRTKATECVVCCQCKHILFLGGTSVISREKFYVSEMKLTCQCDGMKELQDCNTFTCLFNVPFLGTVYCVWLCGTQPLTNG
jgi:hypothetical protein